MPASKFCSNCGESEYIIEKLDKINFVDAQYAIYTKEIIDKFSTLHPDTQIWVEKEGNTIKRLTVN